MNTTGYVASSGRWDHSPISSMTLSVIREMASLPDLRAVDLVEVRGDLAGGQAPRVSETRDVVDAGEPLLALLDQLRLEARVAVAGHLDPRPGRSQ
jgi:hypothetical protein